MAQRTLRRCYFCACSSYLTAPCPMPILAILEDDQRRITAIRDAARTFLCEYELRLFLSAHEMVKWLSTRPRELCLISLDCDLDATLAQDASCGSGEDVVALLIHTGQDYPVLIHSSNAMRAPSMHMELAMAGFLRIGLCPFRDGETWVKDVKSLLDDK